MFKYVCDLCEEPVEQVEIMPMEVKWKSCILVIDVRVRSDKEGNGLNRHFCQRCVARLLNEG